VKILSKFIIRSFIGPLIATFFIVLFILLMQFLWKYIDDLVGKGLDWQIITELLLYTSASLVTLALPLAILLASLITFGNISEKSELIACKAAGIPLTRIMLPLFLIVCLLGISAFTFSNRIIPYTNLKSRSLLYDITRQKPTVNLREGEFFTGIDGYSIKIGEKYGVDNNKLRDIIIYDHSQNRGNTKVIRAEKGTMSLSDNNIFFILTLENGYNYEEAEKNKNNKNRYPFISTQFEKEIIRFNLSSFQLERTNENLYKNNYNMLNLNQLKYSIDSLKKVYINRIGKYSAQFTNKYSFENLSSLNSNNSTKNIDSNLLNNFPSSKSKSLLLTAKSIARTNMTYSNTTEIDLKYKQEKIQRHRLEVHRKFTLSFACLLLFLIGAPLGAIIKKGGLGMPMVVSIMIFVAYHVLGITAEKMSINGIIEPFWGMWSASALFLLLSFILIYRANNEYPFFNLKYYFK